MGLQRAVGLPKRGLLFIQHLFIEHLLGAGVAVGNEDTDEAGPCP